MGKKRSLRSLKRLSIFAFCFVTWTYAQAATFTVNSPGDVSDASPGNGVCEGNGVCTLRAAIEEANALAGPDQIILPPNAYVLTTVSTAAELVITGDLTITGSGASTTIIDGNRAVRPDSGVLTINSGVTVSISGVTIQNGGRTTGHGGGGILNFGAVTLIDSVVSGNTAATWILGPLIVGGHGGGIFNLVGRVTLINSTVSGNSAGGGGGGISGGGIVTLTNSTVSGNGANGNDGRGGGGIYNSGAMTLISSTVSGNSGETDGGGIYNNGTLTLTNSTVSGNSANNSGGGIFVINGNQVNSFASTITENIALFGSGGGVHAAGGVFNFQNTILAVNSQVFPLPANPSDCAGTINSNGNNLMSSLTGCTVNGTTPAITDPLLGPLQDNGGPTLTHAPVPGSPAIDHGNVLGCRDHFGALLGRDQRGFSRRVDGDGNGSAICDIGAVEFGSGTTTVVDLDGDIKTDTAVYQTSSGNWFFVQSAAGFGQQLSFGGSSFLPVPKDYDGDGETDIAVYHTSSGNWFVLGSTTGFFSPALNFGGAGFIPVSGDYDGDGRTDVAVYQTSTGNWFVVGSTSGFFSPALHFGGPGFIPVPADYDGDGKTDVAVYETSSGNWFVVGSTQGIFSPALNFGGGGFIPVPGDYDGDGKTDAAVYQSSTGNWFILRSTFGFQQILNFGGSGFVPVAGDYDGDGKTDAAVYQGSSGNWFVLGSTSGFSAALNFGGSGFVPVLPQVTILRAMGIL